jgi:SAM-dependent methyltransferase
MGIIGGTLGYQLLKAISADGYSSAMDGSVYANQSKAEALLGDWIPRETVGKVVIDFGCGTGAETIEIARRGAKRVIGIDVQERLLRIARQNADLSDVGNICTFAESADEQADVIVTIDSFEHFRDPAATLVQMRNLIRPGGSIIAAFGPTWLHPFGGHLFSPFPWAHLIFTEAALIRWRADFKTDGATRFADVAGGLNQITIRRFERIVERSPLKFASLETVPIRRVRLLANPLTREFTTAIVRCKLVPRS